MKDNTETDVPSDSPDMTKPFTIWDDLAQSNVLIDYVRRFDDSNINRQPRLQATVLDSIYNYSTEVAPEVESFYCKQYHFVLKNFLDRTSQCRQNLAKQLAKK